MGRKRGDLGNTEDKREKTEYRRQESEGKFPDADSGFLYSRWMARWLDVTLA